MPNVIIVRNDYPDAKSLCRVINYVLKNENLAGGYGVPPNLEAAYLQMQFVKRAFYQTDALQLKHFFITLSHTEAAYIDDDELLKLGFLTGELFREYQMVYGVHHDGSHDHLHVVMNTTSFLDGHQYCDGLSMFNRLCDMLRQKYPRFEVHLGYSHRRFSKDEPFSEEDRYQYNMFN